MLRLNCLYTWAVPILRIPNLGRGDFTNANCDYSMVPEIARSGLTGRRMPTWFASVNGLFMEGGTAVAALQKTI